VVTELTVATWNVLAAPWAAPEYYPAGMDTAVLDRVTRRQLVAAELATLDADVVCLQETTPVDLDAIVAALDGRYAAHAAPNGRELWASWSTADVPWEPNGTAILWRTERIDVVRTGSVTLSDDGNVATTVVGRVVGHDVHVRAISVHLDVDDRPLRRTQLATACAHFAPVPDGAPTVDVLAGDCNEDTIATELGTIATAHGYVDVLAAVGNTDPTHPLARPDDDYAPLARLDHVLTRGGEPVTGRVVDAAVWELDVPGDRMVEGLRRTGSDHLAVVARLGIRTEPTAAGA
jgi:endonuclease/exonuclease/phosphatase family metal-dependent hydrolase